MSDALSTDAPETDPAGPATAGSPPGDGTAVVEGSAGGATAEVVDAKRFNGLMSAHQRALDALAAEREARIALESRLQEQEHTPPVTTEDTSAAISEVQALRAELQQERLEKAKAQALAKYPDAAAFSDLIVGNNAQEVESVAAAIAQRMASVKESLGIAPPATTEEAVTTETTTVAPVATTTAPLAPAVPMVTGGNAPPAADTTNEELLHRALTGEGMSSEQDRWDAFFAAKVPQSAQHNLA